MLFPHAYIAGFSIFHLLFLTLMTGLTGELAAQSLLDGWDCLPDDRDYGSPGNECQADRPWKSLVNTGETLESCQGVFRLAFPLHAISSFLLLVSNLALIMLVKRYKRLALAWTTNMRYSDREKN